MTRLLLKVWETWFGEGLRKVEAESLAYRQSEAGRRADWKTVTVLLTAALCLTVQNYATLGWVRPALGSLAWALGGPDGERAAVGWLEAWTADRLGELAWWAAVAVLTYAGIPILVIRLGFRERVSDYGVKLRGALAGWRIYLVFVAVMVPLVYLFSAEDQFQRAYPFYRMTSADEVGARLVWWELLYALQFVALEFFFRGFLVHGTKHRFGAYAVFVMTVPYCMIHYGKPLPEALASIGAGVALGLVSLVTRSIWLGTALHISVAWGMDLACLARRGLLFS
jgi:uncharacterized protein